MTYKTRAQRDAEYRENFQRCNRDGQIRLWRLLKRMIDIVIAPYLDAIVTQRFEQSIQYLVDGEVDRWLNLPIVTCTRLDPRTISVKTTFQRGAVQLHLSNGLNELLYGISRGDFTHMNEKWDFVIDDSPDDVFKDALNRL